MSKDALAIRGFVDAVAEAMAIQQRFTRGHAAAILDDAGTLLDLTVFTAPDHSMHDALDWAGCILLDDDRATRLVLLSAVTASVRRACEADIDVRGRASASGASPLSTGSRPTARTYGRWRSRSASTCGTRRPSLREGDDVLVERHLGAVVGRRVDRFDVERDAGRLRGVERLGGGLPGDGELVDRVGQAVRRQR